MIDAPGVGDEFTYKGGQDAGNDCVVTERADGKNFNPIWWQLKIVLVTDPSVWPKVNATTGLRSVADITNAQAAGKALATINSNFFLFFGSREMQM